jgi:hypothetical protein
MRWLFTHNSVVSGNWPPLNCVYVCWLEWDHTHTRTCTEELDCILLWTGRVHVTQHGDSSLNYWQWRCARQLVAYCIPPHLPVPPPPPLLPPSPPFIALCHLILTRLDIAFTKEPDMWLVAACGTQTAFYMNLRGVFRSVTCYLGKSADFWGGGTVVRVDIKSVVMVKIITSLGCRLWLLSMWDEQWTRHRVLLCLEN